MLQENIDLIVDLRDGIAQRMRYLGDFNGLQCGKAKPGLKSRALTRVMKSAIRIPYGVRK